MRNILNAVSQYERALIRMRIKAALAVKKKRQERIGSVPYGKQLDPDGKTLLDNPEEMKTIEAARAYRDKGMTFRAIAQRLEQEGHRPRGRGWHPQTVSNILEASQPKA